VNLESRTDPITLLRRQVFPIPEQRREVPLSARGQRRGEIRRWRLATGDRRLTT
jgi:hypothetical protein